MRRVALPAVALGLVAAGCGGSSDSASRAQTRTVTVARPVAIGAGRADVPDLVARVLPAVVNVRTRGYDGSRGEGSGVVIDATGLVVTNDHVVSGARTVTVAYTVGKRRLRVAGQVVGAAPSSDLAIIRVRAKGLRPIALGHSSALRLGDTVVAIGFPLDLGAGATVTEGIVSGLDRTIHTEGKTLRALLQTDAAINPGNSGGALIDARGRLIGINTATAAAGVAQNISFAIPIDAARPVIARIRHPSTGAAWLGATFDTVGSGSAAVQLGLPADVRGAVAVAVFAAGPAAKAGLREGQVVVAIDGKAARSAADVEKATRVLRPGRRVTLDVVDQSGPQRLTLVVGRRPATLSGR